MGLAAALALVVGTSTSLAQVGTVISYQGELLESGVPRTADVDLEFRLFDDPTAGSQVGNTVTLSGVTPDAAGRFTTSLDFGVDPYRNDQALYLQISVSNASAGAYTNLSRQRMTAAPFSLATRGLLVNELGNVGVGYAPFWKMTLGTHGNDIGLAQVNVDSGVFQGTFISDDSGYFGTFSPHPLHLFAGHSPYDAEGITLLTSSNVGIGTFGPTARLSVAGMIQSMSAGYKFPDGSIQTTAALNIPGPTGPQGPAGPTGPTGPQGPIGNTGPAGASPLSLNGTSAYYNAGNVGIGTNAPQSLLQVNGVIQSRSSTLTSGYVSMEPGSVGNAGYIEWFKPSSPSPLRLGYMGYSSGGVGNLNLTLENGANYSITSGNVGIGTISPTNALSVAGNANATGNIDAATMSAVSSSITLNSSGLNVGANRRMGVNGIFGNVSFDIHASAATDFPIYIERSNSALAFYIDSSGNGLFTGSLSKAGGSFKIDHPLDPENKFLYHSFVESPDMMNVYNGNITTDSAGYATITMPDYFEALNRDFRYQLTVVDTTTFALVRVSEKMHDGRFTIATNVPGIEVSWQVTGIRHDAWADQNRIPNAVDKVGVEKGKYLHPEAFNHSVGSGIRYATPAAPSEPVAPAAADSGQ